MRVGSAVYQRKLDEFRRKQANEKLRRKRLKNKWYQRRYRAEKRMDAAAAEWLSKFHQGA